MDSDGNGVTGSGISSCYGLAMLSSPLAAPYRNSSPYCRHRPHAEAGEVSPQEMLCTKMMRTSSQHPLPRGRPTQKQLILDNSPTMGAGRCSVAIGWRCSLQLTALFGGSLPRSLGKRTNGPAARTGSTPLYHLPNTSGRRANHGGRFPRVMQPAGSNAALRANGSPLARPPVFYCYVEPCCPRP